MSNQVLSKSSYNPDELACVDINDIHPLRLMSRVRERKIEKRTHVINPRKDLRDFILTILEDTLHHQTPDKVEYIVGSLVKANNRVFFKPIFTDQLILLVSDCVSVGFDYYFTRNFSFDAPFGEIKYLSSNYLDEFSSYYPDDYADSEEIRNLVLNHGLCIDIELLNHLQDYEDDGIWEIIFNEQFSDEYTKILKKKKLFAQRDLINDYVEAYHFYDDLDIEETKEERKQLIRKLF